MTIPMLDIIFLTICVKDKHCILWDEEAESQSDNYKLSNIGIFVDKGILNIPSIYENISIEKYVIMPNHILIILAIHNDKRLARLAMQAPTISNIINQFRDYVTRQVGRSIWQKGYYDHIIRNEKEYIEVCRYIEQNPLKWEEDKYYIDNKRRI